MNKKNIHKIIEVIFKKICLITTLLPLLVLAILIGSLLLKGIARLDMDFILSFPSRKANLAGIYPAIISSIYLISLTIAIAVPIGIASALYLQEYAHGTKWAKIVEVNIVNLAGVPSVIYGLLGLELFVRVLNFGASILSGALTLSLLILPIIITSSREALKSIPYHYREASFGLGASKLQTLVKIILPIALPNILTGIILSTSRALGETAPLIVVGAATYMSFVPEGIMSDFTALPIQIFNWVSRPQADFIINAASGIIVLLFVLMILNSAAIILRNKMQIKSI